jgi:hypothetical protein
MPVSSAVKPQSALAGTTLIVVGIIQVIAMLFHPHANGADAPVRLVSLAEISPLSMHVHLIMIVAIIASWLALSHGSRQWPSPGWAWLAERLYRTGASAMIGAALINGFAVGNYARWVLRAADADMNVAVNVATFAFSLNQVLAGFGTLLMSLGVLAWSIGLRHGTGRLAKIASVYGVIAGAACCLVYASGLIRLDVQGMAMIVAAHAVWYVLAGLLLWSSRKPGS